MSKYAVRLFTRKKISLKYFYFLFFAFLVLSSAVVTAQGDLLLYPKRIVFDGSRRSQTISLANIGKDTVRYNISLVQMRMTAEGVFEVITQPDSGQNFALKYLRFFPRNVVLPPHEAQSVKIQLVNTGETNAGEYRSHMYFRAEPVKKPLGEPEAKRDSAAISIQLVAVFGISIPIILRTGESTTQVNISNASFSWKKDTVPSLNLSLKRTGNMSVYGDVTVDYISVGGKRIRVAKVMGLAVYTPNTIRNINLPLDKHQGINYHTGILYIAYTTQADTKSVKLASTELKLL